MSLLLLTATAWHREVTAAQLSLTWADNSADEGGFKIERKTGTTGTFAQIALVGANITGYTDANLAAGTTYCYRVGAFSAAGDSGYSNEACGTTQASSAPPTTDTTTTTTLPELTTTTLITQITAASPWGMTSLGLAFLGGMAWLLRARRSLR
jgi:fibronectin type 3 domain-containing protein